MATTSAAPLDHTIERELARLVRALEAVRQPAAELPAAAPQLDRAVYLLLDRLASGVRSVGGLASDLHLDYSTVTRQVGGLVDRGWARRSADPGGGRAAVLELTSAGRRRLEAERRSRAERVSRLLETWSDRERNDLARLLTKLNASLDQRLRSTASGDART